MENTETLRAIVVCKYGWSYGCLDQSLWKQAQVQYTLSSAFSAQCQKHLFSWLHFHESKLILCCTVSLPWRKRQKKSRVLISFFSISNIKKWIPSSTAIVLHILHAWWMHPHVLAGHLQTFDTPRSILIPHCFLFSRELVLSPHLRVWALLRLSPPRGRHFQYAVLHFQDTFTVGQI